MSNTAMLHVRIDSELKNEAARHLAQHGLTLTDAVRILLTRINREGGMPPGLTVSEDSYDAWFRKKVREALADPRTVPHEQVMREARALVEGKRNARG
ncbi:TPA: type II toxin-antitoxin system RelB/DinJ family antitoxin [Enterobacter ludwigii]